MYAKYLYVEQKVNPSIVYNKKMKVSEELVRLHLPNIISQLEKLEDWNIDSLKELLINYNKENSLKNGQTLWPIRAILSAVEASPGAFELMNILWKQETLKRLKARLNI